MNDNRNDNTPSLPCRACGRRELVILDYLEDAEVLRKENAGLRNDISWCKEVIHACMDQLHVAHVKAVERQTRYNSLLHEFRAFRAAHAPTRNIHRRAAVPAGGINRPPRDQVETSIPC